MYLVTPLHKCIILAQYLLRNTSRRVITQNLLEQTIADCPPGDTTLVTDVVFLNWLPPDSFLATMAFKLPHVRLGFITNKAYLKKDAMNLENFCDIMYRRVSTTNLIQYYFGLEDTVPNNIYRVINTVWSWPLGDKSQNIAYAAAYLSQFQDVENVTIPPEKSLEQIRSLCYSHHSIVTHVVTGRLIKVAVIVSAFSPIEIGRIFSDKDAVIAVRRKKDSWVAKVYHRNLLEPGKKSVRAFFSMFANIKDVIVKNCDIELEFTEGSYRNLDDFLQLNPNMPSSLGDD